MTWGTVFVSPMRRTIETCIHIFKNHPDKVSIKFVMLPIAHEIIWSSNDVSLGPESIKKLCDESPIDFDMSLYKTQVFPDLLQA